MKFSEIFYKLFSFSGKKSFPAGYIRCPHCATLYGLYENISMAKLAAVHCGTCANIFNGLEHKSKPRRKIKLPTLSNPFQPKLSRLKIAKIRKKPPETDPTLAINSIEEKVNFILIPQDTSQKTQTEGESENTSSLLFEMPSDEYLTEEPPAESESSLERPHEQALNPEDKPNTAPPHLSEQPPLGVDLFELPVKQPKEGASLTIWIFAALGFVAINALIAFFIWSKQDELAQNTFLRPWLLAACEKLNCTLPEYHDPSKLIIQQHQLATDPNNPEHFELHALIQNTAPYAQALSNLEIYIDNLQGERVNALIVAPQQYAPQQTHHLLKPGETLHIKILIKEKMPDIFSYSLKFI